MEQKQEKFEWDCRKWKRTERSKGSVKALHYYLIICLMFAGVYEIYRLSGFITDFPIAYIVFIHITAAMFVICGILGFVGLCMESPFVLKMYAVSILAIIIVEIIDICLAEKFNESVKENSRNIVEIQWNEEIVHPGAMDKLQLKFTCCGNNSSTDYTDILQRTEIPLSCYSSSNQTFFEKGCFTGVEERLFSAVGFWRADYNIIILTCVPFLASVFSVIYYTNRKRRRDYEN